MPFYNKLVRDHIPEIIENSGKKFSIEILDDTRYIEELKKKSFEELEEYCEAESREDALEEMADLLEIMYTLAEYHGSSIEEVEKIRVQKAEKRGGFREKIFLVEVED
ncbi:putative house-cleaning noncanonical NTP pyrophosphatase (MazG superfamily) [Bacillus pakistanensis]|uniref:House-cleaning noncanonical NTP pyrophosphatase (MazG superfamily) n=1 Tax=Rossellomorea pakistanensis TaxID=992288 RepID=A0ABS2N6U9_9BACI|nr:putative house-cleaning noncanonical NTP pyrophosphatase (MazG superfamily) [Bacillus pakistanensis]